MVSLKNVISFYKDLITIYFLGELLDIIYTLIRLTFLAHRWNARSNLWRSKVLL